VTLLSVLAGLGEMPEIVTLMSLTVAVVVDPRPMFFVFVG